MQSIMLAGYYLQRGFNKVNLVAHGEQLGVGFIREQTLCCSLLLFAAHAYTLILFYPSALVTLLLSNWVC